VGKGGQTGIWGSDIALGVLYKCRGCAVRSWLVDVSTRRAEGVGDAGQTGVWGPDMDVRVRCECRGLAV
jgi:hypothetical protein